jgi:hypothetical protein
VDTSALTSVGLKLGLPLAIIVMLLAGGRLASGMGHAVAWFEFRSTFGQLLIGLLVIATAGVVGAVFAHSMGM